MTVDTRDQRGSSNRQASRDRARQALELRKAGATYATIAERLGYNSYQAAYAAVKHLLDRQVVAGVAELRALELARLDDAQLTIYARVRQGDLHAIDRLLRIMERRARLLGLDAPQHIQALHLAMTTEQLARLPDAQLLELAVTYGISVNDTSDNDAGAL